MVRVLFFKGDKKNLEKSLDKLPFAEVEESDFAADFLDIYKNAYKGFWQKLSERFKNLKILRRKIFATFSRIFTTTARLIQKKFPLC